MLTIRLLGPPTFVLNQQSISHLITGRAAALLIYLVVTRHPQQRTRLADLLWENITEQQARTNLRYLLSHLRKVVDDYVVAQGENVAFNQELPHWVDVDAFTTYMGATASAPATVEPEILQALLNLYTGEFLAGFQVEGAPVFERWLLTQQRHLHDLHVQGLRLRTQQHLEHSEYVEGLAINHYLLTLEPWREEAHQQRMLLLAHSGQRSAVLQQYTRCCQALAEELDVSPMQQTTTLYEQIKSGQWFTAQAVAAQHQPLPVAIPAFPIETPRHHRSGTITSPPAAQKPAQDALGCDLGAMPAAMHFAGRHAELATLHSWVGQEQSRLIALLGLNGQGKTALASTFVENVLEDRQRPQHGFTQVIWRSLHGTPSCTALLQGWLQQLDAGQSPLPASFDDLVTRLFAILQTRRCLLVLDGVEEILLPFASVADACQPGCEAYATLLRLFFQRRHRGCLLLTSRVRPAVLTPLEERTGAFHCLEVGGLTPADGAALLAALRISGDSTTIQQLHWHYAGNPHLLYQAANLIYELFHGDAAAFLQEESFFLGNIGATLRHQLTHLPALKQQVLQRLAQAGQPLSRQTLYAQLLPPPPKSDYFGVLQRLQHAFLLRQAGEQFELPALLTAYLAEHSLLA